MTAGQSGPDETKRIIRVELEGRLVALQKAVTGVAVTELSKEDAKLVDESLSEHTAKLIPELIEGVMSLKDPLKDRVVRQEGLESAPSFNPRTKILFLSSDPSRRADGTRPGSALNLDVELREIHRSIRAAAYREQIDLVPRLAVTQREFLEALNGERPKIVHFAGHGDRREGIILQDEQGVPKTVGRTFLAQVFSGIPATLASRVEILKLKLTEELEKTSVFLKACAGED